MKKFFGLLLAVVCVSFLFTGQSFAYSKINFYLDLNTPLTNQSITPTGDGKTGLMSEIQIVQTSEVLQNTFGGFPAGPFSENGVGYASAYTMVGIYQDNEGLNALGGYELTFQFNNLSGNATGYNQTTGVVDFTFNPTGNVSAYLSTPNRNPNINTFDPDFIANYSNYGDGFKIAELTVLGGTGNLDISGAGIGNGSTFLDLAFIDNSNYYGIWFDENNVDLVQNFGSLVLAFVDTTQTDAETYTGQDALRILTAGNGGLELAVVPEPGTILLLGFGLLGLSAISRRKFMKK